MLLGKTFFFLDKFFIFSWLQVERTLWSFFMHLKAIHNYFEKQKKIPLKKLPLFASLTALSI
jgi:hypothetical protein